MRPKTLLTVGLLLSLPILSAQGRLEADGLLKFHRHHHHDHGNASADTSTTVRLPAQNIRIETASPRVIVNELSHHRHHRARGVLAAPMMQAPFVATFLPMTATGGSQNLVSSGLDAVH